MNRYMYYISIHNILEDIEWLEAFYMLLHATITQGKVNVFKYTKHIAIKKYTSEQNLIKTPKHLQNIRKKKTLYFPSSE